MFSEKRKKDTLSKKRNHPTRQTAMQYGKNDLLQVDAYAFLAEGSPKYSPVVGGVIIYNDLMPRHVKPNPERAKEILGKVIELLESDVLPEAEGNIKKCVKCAYYPLCQVLPQKGGLKDTEIKKL